MVDGVKASTDDDSTIATANTVTAKGETVENIMFSLNISMYDLLGCVYMETAVMSVDINIRNCFECVRFEDLVGSLRMVFHGWRRLTDVLGIFKYSRT